MCEEDLSQECCLINEYCELLLCGEFKLSRVTLFSSDHLRTLSHIYIYINWSYSRVFYPNKHVRNIQRTYAIMFRSPASEKEFFFFLSWNILIDYVISYPLLNISQKFIMKYSLTVRSDKQYIGR